MVLVVAVLLFRAGVNRDDPLLHSAPSMFPLPPLSVSPPFTLQLHAHGVNLRFLNAVSASVAAESARAALVVEMVARTVRHIVRSAVQLGSDVTWETARAVNAALASLSGPSDLASPASPTLASPASPREAWLHVCVQSLYLPCLESVGYTNGAALLAALRPEQQIALLDGGQPFADTLLALFPVVLPTGTELSVVVDGYRPPKTHLPRLLRPALLARLKELVGVGVPPAVSSASKEPGFVLLPWDFFTACSPVCKQGPLDVLDARDVGQGGGAFAEFSPASVGSGTPTSAGAGAGLSGGSGATTTPEAYFAAGSAARVVEPLSLLCTVCSLSAESLPFAASVGDFVLVHPRVTAVGPNQGTLLPEDPALLALRLVYCDALMGVERVADAVACLRGACTGIRGVQSGRTLVRLGECLLSLQQCIQAFAALQKGTMALEVAVGNRSAEYARASALLRHAQGLVAGWLELSDLWR